jgi:hypothetical protein
MPNITFKDYIEGIKAKYEEEKTKKYSGYLAKPSPAQLKNLCDILKKKNTAKKDQEIISSFYNTVGFDVDKFKPIGNFFNGKTLSPSHDILDMMALLVDFEPRPLGRFLERNGQLPEEYPVQEIVTTDPSNGKELPKTESPQSLVPSQNNLPKQNHETRFRINKKVIFIGLLTLCIIIFLFMYNLKTHKDCLEWKNDRYMEVSCNTETSGFANLDTKIPYNENLLLLKKIIPTDTTTYFKNEKAIIWYCKNGKDSLELFNAPGHHPVTGKPLHAITYYMINKYLKK